MMLRTTVLVGVAFALFVVGIVAVSFWCLYERDRQQRRM